METSLTLNMQQQIEEASKKAKPKKAMYLYDEAGNRELLGVFNQKKADQIRKYLRRKKLLGRLTEFDVRTTEPDTDFDI
jgi:hypothetical protein